MAKGTLLKQELAVTKVATLLVQTFSSNNLEQLELVNEEGSLLTRVSPALLKKKRNLRLER